MRPSRVEVARVAGQDLNDRQRSPVNLGFEDGRQHDGLPVGWFRCGHVSHELSVDSEEAHTGYASGVEVC